MFQTNFVEKMKEEVYVQKLLFFFLKSCSSWDNVEKYGSTGRPEMIIRRLRPEEDIYDVM
jgi:hypothetical protein